MPQWARDWQRALFDAGWLVPGWPPELGGRNATPTQQMIYFEEMQRREILRSANPQGLGIIAPSINDYGTPEQKERFLLPTLRAEISWCLGMSEPGAGSDLASLKTRAELDRRRVRRERAEGVDVGRAPRRLVPLLRAHRSRPRRSTRASARSSSTRRRPGVERRPFPELSEPDFCDFNEVFFTDVRVPKENLIGPLNGGWPITQGSLAHERAMLWINYAYDLQRAVRALVELGDRGRRTASRSVTTRATATRSPASTSTRRRCMAMGYRGFSKFLKGKSAPEHSLLKLYGSEALQTALLFGDGGARASTSSTSTRSGRRCGATGRGRSSTCAVFGGDDPGRHQRDPAQHHRGACARPPA